MSSLTIIVPTYNRAEKLRRALRRLTSQTPAHPPAQIIVVDNNSTDDTARVTAEFGDCVRYVFEPKQGLSHARNAGIAACSFRVGPQATSSASHIIAFTDDDVEVATDWTAVITREFERQPGIDCLGGRVLPQWEGPPPAWLTREHWAPLALQDHGDVPREFDRDTPICLVGASVAFRASVFDRAGLFSPDVQRVRDGVGSTEDHDMLRRLYDAGGRARYTPDLRATTVVPAERLTRKYHRRWHEGHGRFHAVMRIPEMERSARGRVLGVPAHLYRSAAADAAAWLRLLVAGHRTRAFAAEMRLRFFSGFLRERCLGTPRR